MHIPGETDQFAQIYSSDALNTAFENHRFDDKRLVLFKSGKKIEAGESMIAARIRSANFLRRRVSGLMNRVLRRVTDLARLKVGDSRSGASPLRAG